MKKELTIKDVMAFEVYVSQRIGEGIKLLSARYKTYVDEFQKKLEEANPDLVKKLNESGDKIKTEDGLKELISEVVEKFQFNISSEDYMEFSKKLITTEEEKALLIIDEN